MTDEDHMRLPWYINYLESDKHNLRKYPHNYHGVLDLYFATETHAIEGSVASAFLTINEYAAAYEIEEEDDDGNVEATIVPAETPQNNTGAVCTQYLRLAPDDVVHTLKTEQGWVLVANDPGETPDRIGDFTLGMTGVSSPYHQRFSQSDVSTLMGMLLATGPWSNEDDEG